MKVFSKVICLALSVILLCCCMSIAPSAADGQSQAQALWSLGLVTGYDNTGTNFGLTDKLTRAQAVALVIRYLGVESEVKANTYKTPFTDVPSWAQAYVGYAYKNNITKGTGATIYSPDASVTEAQFLTFLLRAMGYSEGEGLDFVWSNPYTKAKQLGMTVNSSAPASFVRSDAFIVCWNTLSANTKGGGSVADKLMSANVFTSEKYEAAKQIANTTHVGGLTIAGTDISAYKVIVGADCSATEKQIAQALINKITEEYSVTLELATDAVAETANEILVGTTTRAQSNVALETNESYVAVDGTKLVLTGGGASATSKKLAVYFFMSEFATGDAHAIENGYKKCGEIISPLLRSQNSGDPHITYDSETKCYYSVYSSPNNDRVTLYKSETLGGLKTAAGKDVYVAGDADGTQKEVMARLYAPEIHKIDGKWYVYASGSTVSEITGGETACSQAIRLFCLEATSDDPFGDYKFKGWLDTEMRAIDADVFTYGGKNYVLCAEIVAGSGNIVAISELENPWTIKAGTTSRISNPTYEYETRNGKVNEGPFFFVGPTGKAFILFAANNVSSPYYCLSTLELTGENIMKKISWKKATTTSFVSTGTTYSPGHGCVFVAEDGTYWLAYHVKTAADGGGSRYLYIQPLEFDANGCPVLGVPLQKTDYIFAPSGK